MPEQAGSGSEAGLSPILSHILFPGFDPHFGHIDSIEVNLHQVTDSFWGFWYLLLQKGGREYLCGL